MTILYGHKANFETLKRAMDNGDVALVDCRRKDTGEAVVALCAVNFDGRGYAMAPLALLFNDDPYEVLDPPAPDGGYAG